MKFDKDELKNSLTLAQIEEILVELGGEPRIYKDTLISKTICHGGTSHKLYYYSNTHLFRCYTSCSDTFDLFDLIIRIKAQQGEEWTLYNAMSYVANFFSINFETDFSNEQSTLQDWEYFNKRSKEKLSYGQQNSDCLPIFSAAILKNFPRPHIIPWEKEGITKTISDNRGICYDPINDGIVIPHYDINDNLIALSNLSGRNMSSVTTTANIPVQSKPSDSSNELNKITRNVNNSSVSDAKAYRQAENAEIVSRDVINNSTSEIEKNETGFLVPVQDFVGSKVIGCSLSGFDVLVPGESEVLKELASAVGSQIEDISELDDDRLLLGITMDCIGVVTSVINSSDIKDIEEYEMDVEVVDKNGDICNLETTLGLQVQLRAVFSKSNKAITSIEVDDIDDYNCPYCPY